VSKPESAAVPRDIANEQRIRSIVVLGGGSAGLIAAIAIKRRLPKVPVRILRSPDIGVIGVGEGTTSQFPRVLFGMLGLDVGKFYEEAQPQWKLGLKFLWGPRPHFFYSFSSANDDRLPGLSRNNGFYANGDPGDIWTALMEAGRVVPRTNTGEPAFFGHSHMAFHIENVRLVAYLEGQCRELGVEFQDGLVRDVQRGHAGIEALLLDGGARVAADFFVDASGFRSELLGRALGEPFRSYGDVLFCDRAVIGGWARAGEPILPYTTCETMDAGWCWQIEHEHFINRGYVYGSSFISDDDAREELLRKNPKIAPEATRVVKFRSGRHARMWVDNVCAIGNAYGFVEPLEATALGTIAAQAVSLASSLEDSELRPAATTKDVANRYVNIVWDDVRDFLAVHYRFNTRLDTPFWRHCRECTPLGGAADIVEFYRENGPSALHKSVLLDQNNPIGCEGYLALLLGQEVPHARPHSASTSELLIWQRHVAECRAVAAQGFAPAELNALIRKSGWRWAGAAAEI
jgi:tryptophan halogenase